MSLPLPAPESIKVFMLLKQSTGLFLYPTGSSSNGLSSGFFLTREEAEKVRLMEVLGSDGKDKFHIFELDIPNSAYGK